MTQEIDLELNWKKDIQKEIFEMMNQSNLYNIKFSDKPPYWVAVGFKK